MHKIFIFLFSCAFLSGCAGVRTHHSARKGLSEVLSGESAVVEPQGDYVMRGPLFVPPTRRASAEGFMWPLRVGEVSSYFGARPRDFHEGIDIRAKKRSSVYCARDGKVIYSGRGVKGYGNLILVQHVGDYVSVYAHNDKNLIKRGEIVRRGQLIALLGATGRATGPHLHFEVRMKQKAVDPLSVLPHDAPVAFMPARH